MTAAARRAPTRPTRKRAPRMVRLTCRAVHPDPKRKGACGNVLGDVTGPLTFIGVATRRPPKANGRTRLQCGRQSCQMWNIFEVGTR